ncbi:MAG: lipid-A-disaccharide synthase-related protein [Cyanobacteria bacterium]|nr:lipid-A-disaccharide synthase-related protein [Cyanobacteriota bacterium]
MAADVSRILLISNGHGEDLSGSLLGRQLRQRQQSVEAFPLVGAGEAYRQAGLKVIGRTRNFSTGGLGYTSLKGRLTELGQGQVQYLFSRILTLIRQRRDYALVVAVGDLVPVLAAWLSGRPTVVYLVAYSSHYEGKLRLPWPCGWLLRQRRIRAIWSRDALTADDLSGQLGRPVRFLGNPFQDAVAAAATPTPAAAGNSPQGLGLLPGSRLPEAKANLVLLLEVLQRLPESLQQPGALRLQAALVGALTAAEVLDAAAPLGWTLGEAGRGHNDTVLRRGPLVLRLVWHGFVEVLRDSDLVLAMAGTAVEQAVGLGKPVLQLAGSGPQFNGRFAEAQRRLLAPGESGQDATIRTTAAMLAAQLERLGDPERGPAWRRELAEIGAARLGPPGGSARQAEAIMETLVSLRQPCR